MTTIASRSKVPGVEHNQTLSPVRPALFLAWSPPSHTRRSELMARRMGIPLRRVHVLKMKPYLAPLRYVVQAFLTLIILFRERPRAVFVQNPPIFAPLLAWIYCALTGSGLIIDSHTDALQSRIWKWSLPLHRFLSRRALTTIVTNDYLSQTVAQWGARTQIIVDVPSDLPTGRPYPTGYPFNIAMISSFAPDEPLDEVIEVACSLPEVGFYVTGDPVQGFKRLPASLPPNLRLTGFLPDDEYYGLLRSVQAVMALTTEDHTMQRGACEAVWLSQPIITSDWPLLRQAFHKGTIHVDNTVEGIRSGVLQMRARYPQLASEILLLQEERRRQWQAIEQKLDTLIGQT
ncbi:MAG: hypothetical protein NUW24_01140 [Anaerolineae bacterium]|nr:hypothetical protein [Anaerolineae bacterium]MDH7473684.1 hypothetical protein [Anaerolineae bacterium]